MYRLLIKFYLTCCAARLVSRSQTAIQFFFCVGAGKTKEKIAVWLRETTARQVATTESYNR